MLARTSPDPATIPGPDSLAPPAVPFAPVATRRLILIHGAWQGAWAFGLWLPHLRRLGWAPEAVDLPGNGCDPVDRTPPGEVTLQRYVDHVLSVIDREPGPVVVLGHSGGGLTATAVAEAAPERVSALVYLAGMMLPSGIGFAELVRTCQADHPGMDLSGIGPWLADTADRRSSTVDATAATRIFLHDVEPVLAGQLAARLTPQPNGGRDMAPVWTAARMGRVPRIYVEARQDRSLLLPVQRRMQRLVPGAHSMSLDCGHVPQAACPAEAAQRICDVLAHGAPRA
ncbi:MAG: alpha/beta hydrolase [Burkholderiaceae bacterium]|nr:alpha/beta hydrolase [Burkholderiaceae bacterium]